MRITQCLPQHVSIGVESVIELLASGAFGRLNIRLIAGEPVRHNLRTSTSIGQSFRSADTYMFQPGVCESQDLLDDALLLA